MESTVAIYTNHFLSISMTFVYRQLLGVCSEFNPIVFANQVENENLFLYSKVYKKERSMIDKVHNQFLKNFLKHKANKVGISQKRCWGQILVNQDVKLIHAHFGNCGIYILPLARAYNVPLITTFHGYDASQMLNDPRYVEQLRDLFYYSEVIVVSNEMKGNIIKFGADPNRVHVLYCGISVEKFPYIKRISIKKKLDDGKAIHFLQVSNFVEKKGHLYTLKAFSLLAKKFKNVFLHLAGDGPLRNESEVLCKNLGISSATRFYGKIDEENVIKLMGMADVFLHHSVTAANGDKEGIPTVIMEAMSTGLPVISTNHSGIPELIDDGVNGYIVPERNVSVYTKRMDELMKSDEEEMGIRARNKIEGKFNHEIQNQKLCSIYRKTIDKWNKERQKI